MKKGKVEEGGVTFFTLMNAQITGFIRILLSSMLIMHIGLLECPCFMDKFSVHVFLDIFVHSTLFLA